MFKEFKEFAMRGNVVDMAVGIIIGGAFGKIVSSIVNDVVMPPIGVLLGGVDFSNLKILLKKAVVDSAGKVTAPEVAISYGAFINTVINFIIIAASIFVIIKLMNAMKKKEEAKPATPPPPPPPTKDQELLSEIRDLLKSKA